MAVKQKEYLTSLGLTALILFLATLSWVCDSTFISLEKTLLVDGKKVACDIDHPLCRLASPEGHVVLPKKGEIILYIEGAVHKAGPVAVPKGSRREILKPYAKDADPKWFSRGKELKESTFYTVPRSSQLQ